MYSIWWELSTRIGLHFSPSDICLLVALIARQAVLYSQCAWRNIKHAVMPACYSQPAATPELNIAATHTSCLLHLYSQCALYCTLVTPVHATPDQRKKFLQNKKHLAAFF